LKKLAVLPEKLAVSRGKPPFIVDSNAHWKQFRLYWRPGLPRKLLGPKFGARVVIGVLIVDDPEHEGYRTLPR
jgi:hypothetical protein